jgi:hypothetical protein
MFTADIPEARGGRDRFRSRGHDGMLDHFARFLESTWPSERALADDG